LEKSGGTYNTVQKGEGVRKKLVLGKSAATVSGWVDKKELAKMVSRKKVGKKGRETSHG